MNSLLTCGKDLAIYRTFSSIESHKKAALLLLTNSNLNYKTKIIYYRFFTIHKTTHTKNKPLINNHLGEINFSFTLPIKRYFAIFETHILSPILVNPLLISPLKNQKNFNEHTT